MKITHLGKRSLVAGLFLFLLASMSVQAQETDAPLSQLHAFRVSNYTSLDAYYRYTGSGDTDTLNEIVAGVNAANDAMNLLEESTSDALTSEQLEELNREFDRFKSLMRDNINEMRNTGYPDLRLSSDLANQALAMNEMATELYQVAQENSETTINPRVEAARMGAVKIAQMRARYAVRTNSSAGQTFQGSATEVALDEQARELDQLLNTLNNGESEDDLRILLEDISSKWQFIRASYINYNENNVGFVIDRYSQRILEGLTAAIDLLQQTS